MAQDDYIHGRDPRETERLQEQASFIGNVLLDRVEVPHEPQSVLDLGCGVGAMTKLLVERGAVHPIAVDRSSWQVQEAQRVMPRGAAAFAVAAGEALPFADGRFELVYTSWLFEHVKDVPAALREIRRVLVPGGVLWSAEVENASFLAWPGSEALTRTWEAFNESQRALGGDPFVGRKMHGYLKEAGFLADVLPVTFHGHGSKPDQFRSVIREFVEILKSGRTQVVETTRKLDGETYDRAIADLAGLPDVPGATFTYTFLRSCATKERRGKGASGADNRTSG